MPLTPSLVSLMQCLRYSIPAGDVQTRMNTLQQKYDEEYEVGQREYEEFAKRLEEQKHREEFLGAVHNLKALEQAALEREPKIHTIVRQVGIWYQAFELGDYLIRTVILIVTLCSRCVGTNLVCDTKLFRSSRASLPSTSWYAASRRWRAVRSCEPCAATRTCARSTCPTTSSVT